MKSAVVSLALTIALAGCGSTEEQLSPLTTSGPADAGIEDAGADVFVPPPPPYDAGVVKRTVMTRNPFGGPTGNLLIDGDFEMSTTYYSGQFGWRAFTSDGGGEVALATETGGLCRSGLRCAVLQPSMLILIRGASANKKGNVASAWAKVPPDESCSRVHPMLIECDRFVVMKTLSLEGSEGGWCHYAVTMPEQDSAMCMYVENTLPAGKTALLDNFVLGPDDGTILPLSGEHWVPTPETAAKLENMRALVIATTPFGKSKAMMEPKVVSP